MPKGENYWNPYRWVTMSNSNVEYEVPNYHYNLGGLSGRIWCELKALTPLLIGAGQLRDTPDVQVPNDHDGEVSNIDFVRYDHNDCPYIPATSLKGPIRALAEVVGNATVPFPKVSVDAAHRLARGQRIINNVPQLETVARTFGYLNDKNVFAGLIQFSDAAFIDSPQPPDDWQWYTIVVGQPKSSHRAFYPGYPASNKRKFYHHHPGVSNLEEAPDDIRQVANVRPAPTGTRFKFTIEFRNLRDDELNLLLYCLELEEQVTVTLGAAALGREAHQSSVTLVGPLRHKIGGAKPHGAGSVHIQITKMELCSDASARYRGGNATQTLKLSALRTELNNRTASFCGRTDLTMNELRAMLIYTTNDPRRPIRYPDFSWFRRERNRHPKTQLKPTL